jgi:hypothetical protein
VQRSGSLASLRWRDSDSEDETRRDEVEGTNETKVGLVDWTNEVWQPRGCCCYARFARSFHTLRRQSLRVQETSVPTWWTHMAMHVLAGKARFELSPKSDQTKERASEAKAGIELAQRSEVNRIADNRNEACNRRFVTFLPPYLSSMPVSIWWMLMFREDSLVSVRHRN